MNIAAMPIVTIVRVATSYFSHLKFSASAYQENYGQRFHVDLHVMCKIQQFCNGRDLTD